MSSQPQRPKGLGITRTPDSTTLRFCFLVIAFVANFSILLEANGAITVFTDRASWEAAISSPTLTEDFNSFPVPGAQVSLPLGTTTVGIIDILVVGSGGAIAVIYKFGGPVPGGDGQDLVGQTARSGLDTFSIIFPSPVNAFGAGFSDTCSGQHLTLNVAGSTVEFDNYLPSGSPLFGDCYGFLGVVATEPFDSVTFGQEGSSGNEVFRMDNVSFAPFSVAVFVDIKPQGCPNPLNTKSKGVTSVAILGTADFDITQIDIASLRLEGVAPVRSSMEDVATPFTPTDGLDDAHDCNDFGPDGFADLTLKFDTQDLIQALGDVEDGEVRVVTLTGVLHDGTPIEGQDVVVIKAKGGGNKNEPLAAAPLSQTGQTGCFDVVVPYGEISCTGTGQDGEFQVGIPVPDPRFTDNGNGTVTDRLTGLTWLQNVNCFGELSWAAALAAANNLADGQCDLSDGSVPGDWRLPNIKEQLSLHDLRFQTIRSPAPGAYEPFTNRSGATNYWWTSTSAEWDTSRACTVGNDLIEGHCSQPKYSLILGYAWPVKVNH
jgi:hypothetical protein